LESRLGHKFPASRIAESLGKANGYPLHENWFVFGYADEVIQEIERSTGIPLTHQFLKTGDIRKILGDTKK